MFRLHLCLVILSFFAATNAVIIVPTPVLQVGNVTTETISLSWLMPINEDYDNFTVTVTLNDEPEQIIHLKDTNVVIDKLSPGTLYNISVTAYRGQLISDPDSVLQDTVPLPPINLKLSCFDELILTLEGPFFSNTQFTVKVYGIEAKWDKPQSGLAECFDAEIELKEGHMSVPAADNKVQSGETFRQFLQLTPGHTYTVTVYTSTCGQGSLGALRSEPIRKSLLLKPDSPGEISVQSLTDTSATLDWSSTVLQGLYDNFELILVNGTSTEGVLVDIPEDPKTLSRTVYGLKPCGEYWFQLFTLYKDSRSKRSQYVVIRTPPPTPSNLKASNIKETSFLLSWQGSTEGVEYKVNILDEQQISGTRYLATKLSPGTRYTATVSSVCSANLTRQSQSVSIEVTTRPSPASAFKVTCSPQADSGFVNPKSTITLEWGSPGDGKVDGFVVDYSPYRFEDIDVQHPVSLAPDVRRTQISVPAGRVYTIYLRTIANNVLGEAAVEHAVCNYPGQKLIQHCRTTELTWNILIMAVNNSKHLLIKIPNHPMHNATIVLPDRDIITKEYTILIDYPCDNPFTSKIIVFPVCEDPSQCYVVVRRLCAFERRLRLSGNHCCSGQVYNPQRSRCCHGHLIDRSDENQSCCFTQWYDTSNQKCCGLKDNTGLVQAAGSTCL